MRVWDVTGNVPGLLATVPFDSGGPGVRLRPVSCLQVLLLTFPQLTPSTTHHAGHHTAWCCLHILTLSTSCSLLIA